MHTEHYEVDQSDAVTGVSSSANGVCTVTEVDAEGTEREFRLNALASGSATITITATNPQGSDTTTIDVTVSDRITRPGGTGPQIRGLLGSRTLQITDNDAGTDSFTVHASGGGGGHWGCGIVLSLIHTDGLRDAAGQRRGVGRLGC